MVQVKLIKYRLSCYIYQCLHWLWVDYLYPPYTSTTWANELSVIRRFSSIWWIFLISFWSMYIVNKYILPFELWRFAYFYYYFPKTTCFLQMEDGLQITGIAGTLTCLSKVQYSRLITFLRIAWMRILSLTPPTPPPTPPRAYVQTVSYSNVNGSFYLWYDFENQTLDVNSMINYFGMWSHWYFTLHIYINNIVMLLLFITENWQRLR